MPECEKMSPDMKIMEDMGQWALHRMLEEGTLTEKEVITALNRKVKAMKEDIKKLSFYPKK